MTHHGTGAQSASPGVDSDSVEAPNAVIEATPPVTNQRRLRHFRLLSIGAPIVAATVTLSFVFVFERFAEASSSAVPEIVLYLNMVLGVAGSTAAGFYSHFDVVIRVTRALANFVVGFVAYWLTIVIVGQILFS